MKEVQEQNVRETDSKQPYTKPTLTKHKPLRDITAQQISPSVD
ncbi:hypothetical protein [Candidatus Methylomirabilis limnetica]|nr:hypothetical protein [Candidatus Methylomirabilis limnetica]